MRSVLSKMVLNKTKIAKYYYIVHDTDINNLPDTAANFELIENLLSNIKPRKKLFFMDTCESGELDEKIYTKYHTLATAKGLKPRTFRKPSKIKKKGFGEGRTYLHQKDRFIYNNLQRRTGAIVFSSSRGGEISYESPFIKNGFFTRGIINALTNKIADINKNGKIDSNELRDFVQKLVIKNTEDLQHPTVDRDNLYQKIELPCIAN